MDAFEQDREDMAAREGLFADHESTEEEVAEAIAVEQVLEASRRCRENDLMLFDALRKAGCL